MKISKKQQSEIDFLSNYFGGKFTPTDLEIEEYIDSTVHGKGKGFSGFMTGELTVNKLKLAKRNLDINIKDWARDMEEGLLAHWELTEDFNNHPYVIKIINTIRKSLIPKPSYDGLKELAALGFLNSKYALNERK